MFVIDVVDKSLGNAKQHPVWSALCDIEVQASGLRFGGGNMVMQMRRQEVLPVQRDLALASEDDVAFGLCHASKS